VKLYEIADEIELILARDVNHETGEMTEETLDALTDLEMGLNEKALAVAAYMKGELAEAEAVDREIDKQKARAKGHASRADWLKFYLMSHIPAGVDPIEDGRSRIAWKKNPPKVVLDMTKTVPVAYLRTIPSTTEPDKKKIKAALDADTKLDFARMQQTSRLEIK
jgi:hypothetical protein